MRKMIYNMNTLLGEDIIKGEDGNDIFILPNESPNAFMNRKLREYQNPAVFYTDTFKQSGNMDVGKFHLPFKSMRFSFSKPQRMIDGFDFNEVDIMHLTGSDIYSIAVPGHELGYGFRLKETGEIIPLVANLSGESGSDKVRESPELYDFYYDIISTIDYLNHSELVVTQHSRKKNTGERMPKGILEKRIKVSRHHGKTVTTGTGTKHRYKYRVRGHFRTVAGEKETWIKDHVRGGEGTIFIPKEYEIET